MNKNTIKFRNNGKLVIMQVSDAQDLAYVRKAMTKMLDEAYDTVKPDLVLFTGDNILGNHLLDARIGTRKIGEGWFDTFDSLQKSLAHILEPLEKRKIPFGMIFGNHDDMNDVSKDEQLRIFRSYSCCLPLNDDNDSVDGDTYNIPIMSHDGKKVLFNLWMLDSAWKNKETGECFCAIKEETTEWFKKTNAALTEENGGEPVPSLMFLHVPLEQENELLVPCKKRDKGAVSDRKGGFVKLDVSKAKGVFGEIPDVCTDDAGLFDAVQKAGNVLALVGGHDHLNSFDGTVRGVRFIQTACASFRCYGNRERGVRLFILDENKPGEFETRVLTYDDICGKSVRAQFRYFWDADDKAKQKAALIAGAAVALTGTVIKAIKSR